MAYKIMKNLIQNSTKSKEELLGMADVYFAVGRLTEEQYKEINGMIGQMMASQQRAKLDTE